MLKRESDTEKKGTFRKNATAYSGGDRRKRPPAPKRALYKHRGCRKHQAEKNISADDNITSPIGGGAEQGESPRAFRILQENLPIGKELIAYGRL